MSLPISVFIIAQNEADRIPVAIKAVRDWADEVIVIDSGSDDATVAVSEELGARVVFNAWRGYGPQKVFGETLCRNDWILNVDADEEISPPLAAEIRTAFAHGDPAHDAYTLPILPMYPTQQRGHPWTAFHHPVRLYRKACCGFKDSPVHDTVEVEPGHPIGHFRGMVRHRSFRSLAHHVEKLNGYSSAQAEDLFRKGRRPSALTLAVLPALAFFKQFVLRREFVNGVDGLVVSHMYAFQRFIRIAKARERYLQSRQNPENHPENRAENHPQDQPDRDGER